MKSHINVVIAALAAVGALPFLFGDRASPVSAISAETPAGAHALNLAADPLVAMPPQSACSLTATALFLASKREAQDDFWVAVARCRNGTSVGDCIDDAEDEMDEAFDLADDQKAARLALCPLLGSGPYNPVLNPADFSPNVTNPLFPLVPGRTLVYEKMTPEGLERVEVTTTADVIVVNGIPCRVVRDVVTLDGELVEDTDDWFSQKSDGTVWYLGEIARNYEDGLLTDLDGSWRYGKDGAKPGIAMLAMPIVGAGYRIEFDPNNAEDVAKVLSINATVLVPVGMFTGCLKTEDSTPIQPGNIEHKFYAPGIGLVRELDPGSGESLELVQILN